jgi:DNA-binding transcriptional MerR regulator
MEYTSGQFAKLMGISLDTLRYYEKEKLIIPNRKENNHRIYTDNDISWMQFIKRLKDTGMPIKEIRKYSQLRSEGPATMSERMNMLISHRYSLNQKIKQLEEHQGKLDEKIEYYKNQLEQ